MYLYKYACHQYNCKGGVHMATNSVAISSSTHTRSISQGAVVVLGRFFFALIFLIADPNHFTRQTIAFSASQGVPLASIAVPLSGVVAIAGGLSILLGYRAKLGAWLLVLFLIPVTLMLHKFWTVDRKSTRLNSSHRCISYAVFCLKKKIKYNVH